MRDINTTIIELEERFGPDGHVTVLCECGTAGCTDRLEVPTQLFEEIRADMTRFIVASHHALADSDRIVAETSQYRVVASTPEAPPARLGFATA